MGGTPLIELYIVYRELHRFLDGRGITIARNLIGNYITSLEMAGCSITLLKLDDELVAAVGRAGQHPGAPVGSVSLEPVFATGLSASRTRWRRTARSSRSSTPRSATAITERTWTAACARRSSASRPRGRRHRRLLKAVGMALVSSVGGAAGPLYGTLFMQMGSATAGKSELDVGGLRRCARCRRRRACRPAGRPSRATRPWSTPSPAPSAGGGLRDGGDLAAAARRGARQGMKATIPLVARKGRASYLGPRSEGHQDPGATSTVPVAA